jgi:hypothetical protein
MVAYHVVSKLVAVLVVVASAQITDGSSREQGRRGMGVEGRRRQKGQEIEHGSVQRITGLVGWEGCTLEHRRVDEIKSLSELTAPVLLVNATSSVWSDLFPLDRSLHGLLHSVRMTEIEVRLPVGINQVRTCTSYQCDHPHYRPPTQPPTHSHTNPLQTHLLHYEGHSFICMDLFAITLTAEAVHTHRCTQRFMVDPPNVTRRYHLIAFAFAFSTRPF